MPDLWYPKAIRKPLLNHSDKGTVEQRNTIILHITEGTTAGGAIATFEQSQKPYRESSHFITDRDTKIYQLIPINETAFHASQINSHSVGIEHVALSAEGAAALNRVYMTAIASGKQQAFQPLPVKEEQYAASAELIVWLSKQLRIPIDRNHIRTHNEASPRDLHVQCCTGALDPDKLVNMAKDLSGTK